MCVCVARCGRCDHLIANAAASVLDTAHQGEVPETGQNADGDDGTATTTTTATHHLVELAVNVPKVIADDGDENSEGAEDNDDNGDSDGVVAEDDAEAPDKMTPQEHVLALTLLLKQVSMENEHLKLSMSQCEVCRGPPAIHQMRMHEPTRDLLPFIESAFHKLPSMLTFRRCAHIVRRPTCST